MSEVVIGNAGVDTNVYLYGADVDTNGAGDSLAAGFLTSYVLDGFSLDEAVQRGQIAARHACTLRGTADGLLTRAQLDFLYSSARATVPKT